MGCSVVEARSSRCQMVRLPCQQLSGILSRARAGILFSGCMRSWVRGREILKRLDVKGDSRISST